MSTLDVTVIDPEHPPVVDLDWSDGETTLLPLPVVNLDLIVGVPGQPGGAPNPIVYDLTSASSFYRSHTFGYPPWVRLVLTDGTLALVGAEYPDSSHVAVSFPQPYTGKLILS